MKHNYSISYTLLVLLFAMLSMSFVINSNTVFDSIPTKFQAKSEHVSYLKNGLRVTLPAIKPLQIQSNPPKQNPEKGEYEKVLNELSIYPNPVTDKIYVNFSVKKNSNVSIKIMDLLGNEVLTLLTQYVEAGDQKNVFMLNNKLPKGFYFVRIIVGTESFIRRISVV